MKFDRAIELFRELTDQHFYCEVHNDPVGATLHVTHLELSRGPLDAFGRLRDFEARHDLVAHLEGEPGRVRIRFTEP